MQKFADQGGVPGGAAGDNEDFLNLPQFVISEVESLQIDRPLVLENPAGQGIGNGARLLVDFLEHEMAIAAFLRHQRTPGDRFRRFFLAISLPGRKMQIAVLLEDNEFAIVEKDHLAGMRKHGGNVGGDKKFAVSLADDQGGAEFGGDHRPRFLLAEDGDRIGAANLGKRQAHGFFEIAGALDMVLDQVGDDFRIGLRTESMPGFPQALLEGEIVLDDAVVHNDDAAGIVRMRVRLRWPAVGCPAGMADAAAPLHRPLLQRLFQIDSFPWARRISILPPFRVAMPAES